jgi:membrane fusion protein, multidrug efflux system
VIQCRFPMSAPSHRGRIPRMPFPLRVLLFALALAAAAGCGGREARRPSRVPVTVATAEVRSVPLEWEATGTVEPMASADVTAQVGGLVTHVLFREGADVRAGQALVRLDTRAFAAAVAQAEAVLERDRAQARSARLELERAETLAKQGVIATGDLENKRDAAAALAATVRADEAMLARARLDLAHATVRAPISGRTGRLRVHVGDLVKAADPAAPVVSIHQLRPIRVAFTVPQSDLVVLRQQPRHAVRVLAATADSNWVQGRLAFLDNQVDVTTGTVLLKGEFANRDGELWPGAFVRVRLRLKDEADVTVVPSAAVGNSQRGPYLYVVLADTSVELRPVQVVRTWQGLAVVASGVKAGELVVTEGQVRLSPGARATIRTPGGPPADPRASAPGPSAPGTARAAGRR